jgi:hypothetical protein
MIELKLGVAFSDHVDEIFSALAAAQNGLKNAAKNREGHTYRYADLSSILADVRPVLVEHGLFVTQWPSLADEGHIAISTLIGHRSGQWMKLGDCDMSVEPSRNMSRAQAVGSVITYARRYALQAALGISSTDDDQDARRVSKFDMMGKMELIVEVQELCAQLDQERGHQEGEAEKAAIRWKSDNLNRGRKPESRQEMTRLEEFTEQQLATMARGAERAMEFELQRRNEAKQ